MKRLGGFLKSAAKWGGILLLGLIGWNYLTGLDFESRMGWIIFAFAMALAYVDGSLKDRIRNLEYRVDQLNKQLNGH